MKRDRIIEIGIDDKERLYLKPEIEKFTMIYRSAAEVHWDNDGRFLYSPKPREWTYLDWYKHIVSLIKTDCNCELYTTTETKWLNIPEQLWKEIKRIPETLWFIQEKPDNDRLD